jgi:hypothetical protein
MRPSRPSIATLLSLCAPHVAAGGTGCAVLSVPGSGCRSRLAAGAPSPDARRVSPTRSAAASRLPSSAVAGSALDALRRHGHVTAVRSGWWCRFAGAVQLTMPQCAHAWPAPRSLLELRMRPAARSFPSRGGSPVTPFRFEVWVHQALLSVGKHAFRARHRGFITVQRPQRPHALLSSALERTIRNPAEPAADMAIICSATFPRPIRTSL